MPGVRAAEDALWESHRRTISQLYVENNQPLDEVISFMVSNYNFNKSKAQYERVLRKWKIRKYLAAPERQYISHRVEKDRRCHKRSKFFIDGELLEQQKVQKIARRHFETTLERLQRQCREKSPDCPTSKIIVSPLPPNATHMAKYPMKIPWLDFLGLLAQQAQPQVSSLGQSSLQNATFTAVLKSFADQSLPKGYCPDTKFGEDEDIRCLVLNMKKLTIKPNKNHQSSYISPYFHAIHLPGISNHVRSIYGNQALRTPLGISYWKLLQAMGLLSNNAGSWELAEEVVDLCQSQQNRTFLEALLDTKLVTALAMAEKLLVHAVHRGDAVLAQVLLKAGINPNAEHDYSRPLRVAVENDDFTMVSILVEAGASIDRHRSFTEVEVAVRRGNLGISRYLLEHNADPNINSPSGNSILSTAVRTGNLKLIQLLMEYKADPNHADAMVLEAAGSTGKLELVQFLLQCGYRINEVDAKGYGSVLSASVRSGSEELCKFLISHGAHVNGYARNGKTPIQEAVDHKNIPLVCLLLKSGANPGLIFKSSSGVYQLPATIFCASRQGNLELVDILLQHGADIDKYTPFSTPTRKYGNALMAAIESENSELVAYLLRKGAPVNNTSEFGSQATPLQACIEVGNLDLAAEFIQLGASVDDNGALWVAVLKRDQRAVMFLLDMYKERMGPSIKNDYGWGALTQAAAYGDIELLEILLRAGIETSQRSRAFRDTLHTCIMKTSGIYFENCRPKIAIAIAVSNMHFETVELLMGIEKRKRNSLQDHCLSEVLESAIAELDARHVGAMAMAELLLPTDYQSNNCSGRSEAFYEAVRAQNIELMTFLLDRGADINFTSVSYGQTALRAAAANGNVGLVKFLLGKGAKVRVKELREIPALQIASMHGHIEVVRTLLDAGADVNALSLLFYVRTALELAAESGRLDTVRLLLDAGADISGVENKQYKNAIKYAWREGHMVVANLIQDYKREKYGAAECTPLEEIVDSKTLWDDSESDFDDTFDMVEEAPWEDESWKDESWIYRFMMDTEACFEDGTRTDNRFLCSNWEG